MKDPLIEEWMEKKRREQASIRYGIEQIIGAAELTEGKPIVKMVDRSDSILYRKRTGFDHTTHISKKETEIDPRDTVYLCKILDKGGCEIPQELLNEIGDYKDIYEDGITARIDDEYPWRIIVE